MTTATTEAPASQATEIKGTVTPAQLYRALHIADVVNRGAAELDTLHQAKIRAAGPQHLIVEVTDRYIIARAHLEASEGDLSGLDGFALGRDDISRLIKHLRGNRRSPSVDIASDGERLTCQLPDGTSLEVARHTGDQLPNLSGLDSTPTQHLNRTDALGISVRNLAKLAKIEQVDKGQTLVLSTGECDGQHRPLRFRCGDWLYGLVMPTRLHDGDLTEEMIYRGSL